MRKLKLEMESLTVVPSETAPGAETARGAVFGHAFVGAARSAAAGFRARAAGAACDTTLCASAECPATCACPSAIDACPTRRGCF